MNEKNLIPFDKMPPEQAKAIRSKGGYAKRDKYRKAKSLKTKMRMLLDLPVNNCEDFNTVASMGIDMEDIDNELLMLVGLFQEAKKGNVQAVREIRNIIGDDNFAEELKLRKKDSTRKDKELDLKEKAFEKDNW